jgi:glycosyltransferase involved in cell wall biosynthesis
MEKMLGRITHHQIALTPEECDDYLNLKVSKPGNTSVIHSGVDLQRFSQGAKERIRKRAELGLPTDSLVIGYVGWLIFIKGVSYLVSAMKNVAEKYPKSLLVLVGKGDDKGEEEIKLKRQVERAGLEYKVRFLGWRSDVDEVMDCFDIFVLPSLNEGMGRVLVEAMAAGKPIIASRVGGILDLVKDGFNGLLVEPGNPGALCDAIKELLNDRRLRDEMGQRGRDRAKDFTVDSMIEKIDGLYASVFQRNNLDEINSRR